MQQVFDIDEQLITSRVSVRQVKSKFLLAFDSAIMPKLCTSISLPIIHI